MKKTFLIIIAVVTLLMFELTTNNEKQINYVNIAVIKRNVIT